MKKKKTLLTICAVAVIVLLLGWINIRDYIQTQKYKALMEKDFDKLFITERASVAALSEALDTAIQEPNETSYAAAFAAAQNARDVCAQTHGQLESDGVPMYGSELVYIPTFFRDIKAQLNSGCDPQFLGEINEFLGQILALYDRSAASSEDKGIAMQTFFHDLALLNEDMTKFVLHQ